MEQISVQEFARRIKSKYPQYKDKDDLDLTIRYVKKHPVYAPKVNLQTTPEIATAGSSIQDLTKPSFQMGIPKLPAAQPKLEWAKPAEIKREEPKAIINPASFEPPAVPYQAATMKGVSGGSPADIYADFLAGKAAKVISETGNYDPVGDVFGGLAKIVYLSPQKVSPEIYKDAVLDIARGLTGMIVDPINYTPLNAPKIAGQLLKFAAAKSIPGARTALKIALKDIKFGKKYTTDELEGLLESSYLKPAKKIFEITTKKEPITDDIIEVAKTVDNFPDFNTMFRQWESAYGKPLQKEAYKIRSKYGSPEEFWKKSQVEQFEKDIVATKPADYNQKIVYELDIIDQSGKMKPHLHAGKKVEVEDFWKDLLPQSKAKKSNWAFAQAPGEVVSSSGMDENAWKREYDRAKKIRETRPKTVGEKWEADIVEQRNEFEGYMDESIAKIQTEVKPVAQPIQNAVVPIKPEIQPLIPEDQMYPDDILTEPAMTKEIKSNTITTPSSNKFVTDSPDIIKESAINQGLTETLGVPARQGKFNQRAAGIYKPKEKVIRQKVGGVPVLTHEAGHFVWDTNKEFIPGLRSAERIELKLLDYDLTKKRAKEGFAEFVRLYVTEPIQAKAAAPRYFNQFEQILKSKPVVQESLFSARKDYQLWKEMPAVAKVQSKISFEPTKTKKYTFDEFYRQFVSDVAPIENFSKLGKRLGLQTPASQDPGTLVALQRGWEGKADHFFSKGTFDPATLEITGKSLKDTIKSVDKIKAMDDFNTYLVSRHVPELEKMGKRTGISSMDAQKAISDLEKKYPMFKQAAQEIYVYQKSLLSYLFKTGMLKPESYKILLEKYNAYVPFHRVFESMQRKGYFGKSMADISNPIKRIKGSEREIIPPIESIMKNTYTFINSAERNRVSQSMASLAKRHFELGRLFEEVPPDMAKVANVKASQMFSKQEVEGMGLPEEMLDVAIDIFRPSMYQKDNVVSTLINGKKHFYQVDPDIYKALSGMDSVDLGLLGKILSFPAKTLRLGSTSLSAEFLGKNVFRDQQSAMFFSNYGYKPFIDLWGGVAAAIGKTDNYWLWLRSGGAHSAMISVDREYIKNNVKELMKGKIGLNPVEAMRALNEIADNATRLGEFKLGLKKGADPLTAAASSRQVSLDFQRSGTVGKAINSIVAFWNANTQDMDQIARTFIDHPGRSAAKVTLGLVMPSTVLYMMNRNDPRYQQLPRWQKDIAWFINTGKDRPLIPIPKPFFLGVLFASGTERMLEWLDRRDPNAFDSYANSLLNAMGGGLLPNAIQTPVENAANYSFFRNQPIESPSMQKRLPEDRFYNTTPSTLKWAGKIMHYSPAKLDNLIRGYFGTLGSSLVSAPDTAMKVLGTSQMPLTAKDIPVLRSFVQRDPYGMSSQSITDFYNEFEIVNQAYNSIMDAMKTGNKKRVSEIQKEHPNWTKSSAYTGFAEQISSIRNAQEYFYNNPQLNPQQRKKEIDRLNKMMTENTKKFLQQSK